MATSQSGTDLTPVTEADFTRAETHLYFGNSLKAGGRASSTTSAR